MSGKLTKAQREAEKCKSCLRGKVAFIGFGFPKRKPEFKCGYCNQVHSQGYDGGDLAHLVPQAAQH